MTFNWTELSTIITGADIMGIGTTIIGIGIAAAIAFIIAPHDNDDKVLAANMILLFLIAVDYPINIMTQGIIYIFSTLYLWTKT